MEEAKFITDAPDVYDRLGYDGYAKALAKLICETSGQAFHGSLTVGIDGRWGYGKTTLLRLVDQYVAIEIEPKQKMSVRFQALQYERSEQLWEAFLSKFVHDLQKELWLRSPIRCVWLILLRAFSGRLKIELLTQDILIALTCSIALLVVSMVHNLLRYLPSASVVMALTAVAAPVRRSFGALRDLKISDYRRDGDEGYRRAYVDEFIEEVRKLIKATADAGFSPLLVYVDDLDRCTPESMVDVIEAINVIMQASTAAYDDADRSGERPADDAGYNCIFFVAYDSGTVAASMDQKYKDIDVPDDATGMSIGRRFLEKMINVNVRLAPVHEVAALRLLQFALEGKEVGTGRKTDWCNTSYQVLPTDVDALSVVSPSFAADHGVYLATKYASTLLGNNPRRMKSFVNHFHLRLLLCKDCRLDVRSWPLKKLVAKAVIVSMLWPDVVDELAEGSRGQPFKPRNDNALLNRIIDSIVSNEHDMFWDIMLVGGRLCAAKRYDPKDEYQA